MALPNEIIDPKLVKERNSIIKSSIALLLMGGLLMHGHVSGGGWAVLLGLIGLLIGLFYMRTTRKKKGEFGVY
jgi:hypothetical protein